MSGTWTLAVHFGHQHCEITGESGDSLAALMRDEEQWRKTSMVEVQLTDGRTLFVDRNGIDMLVQGSMPESMRYRQSRELDDDGDAEAWKRE